MINLKPVRLGLMLALLSILFGYLFGIAFGAWEEGMKDDLRVSGEAVLATVYQGDEAALNKALGSAWTYYKRAHLHAGALGTAAVAQILLLTVLAAGARWKAVTSLLLGAGALGYSVFWMLAAQRIPVLGGSEAARESLDWLAIPSSGGCLIGTILVIAFAARTLFGKSPAA
jgi:uncharacterized membrane protein YebE (DUF533 family)